jgi:predicted HAD superfamily Cof-like phosphohydrolase
MNAEKISLFMELAGQETKQKLQSGDPQQRALGAQLLLSEVLEYVIKGLGVIPEFEGTKITKPDALNYHPTSEPNHEEMLDGLADVAYTMYWNACAFGIPLEQAFELVCDNNLEKFVALDDWSRGVCTLTPAEWDCGKNVSWPPEVVVVDVVNVKNNFYAVGKDARGKVRKPSTYTSVDLEPLVVAHQENSAA